MSERERREVKRLDSEQARQYRNLRESNVPHETALQLVLGKRTKATSPLYRVRFP